MTKKPYTADRQTIKKQLDELLDKGKISQQSYDWGITGLNVVHGMLADGQKAEREAEMQDDIPF